MSNPSVIKLAEVKLSNTAFVVEDNLGEAIHIHFSNFRIDLTISELHQLAEEASCILDSFVSLESFHTGDFDGSFLLQLAECLPELEKIEQTEKKVKELVVDTKAFGFIPVYRRLPQSRVVKALNGDAGENDGRVQDNFWGESNQERVRRIYNSVKSKGFQKKAVNIVLYNDRPNIMDGQHRAASQYVLDPEATVPVTVMKFRNYKHSAIKHPALQYLFSWNLRRIVKCLKIIYRALRKKICILYYRFSYRLWRYRQCISAAFRFRSVR